MNLDVSDLSQPSPSILICFKIMHRVKFSQFTLTKKQQKWHIPQLIKIALITTLLCHNSIFTSAYCII